MGSRRLDVSLHLDRSEYTRSEKAAREESKKTAKALVADVDGAEKTKRELIKETAAATRKIDKEIAQSKKDARREATQAVKDFNQSLSDADKKRAAESKAIDAELARIKRESMREAARNIKIFNETATAAEKKHEDAVRAQKEAWDGQQASIMGAVKGIGSFALSMAGLNSATTVLSTILEHFQKLRDASIDGADRMLQQGAKMRSLSSVMGQTGHPAMTQVDMIKLASQTMQTPEDAAAMFQSAMGKGFGAVAAGLVTEAELRKAAVSQGKRQTLYGESAEPMGMILGMLPAMNPGKMGQTGEELEQLNQRLDDLRKLAGYKNYAQAVGQLERVSPYVLKGIYSGPMAMALTGAMALGGVPEEAGTHLEHATQAVTSGLYRARLPKVSQEDKDQFIATTNYFKGLKDSKGRQVTEQMKPEERLMGVVDDVMRAEDEATKAGKHFEGTMYLGHKGFTNEQHALALLSLVGVHRSGQLQQMIDAANAPLGPAAPGQGIGDKFADAEKDPVMANLFAERQSDLVEQAAFAKDRFRTVQARAAFNRLGGKGQFGEDVPEILKRRDIDPYEIMFGPKIAIEMEAQDQIAANARKAGVKLPAAFLDTPGATPFQGWDKLFDIAQQTGGKGGQILPGMDTAAIAANTKAVEALTAAMTGKTTPIPVAVKAPGGVAAPIPGKAPPVQTRP